MKNASPTLRYQIEQWVIVPDQNIILKGETAISVEPKTMDVLLFLIANQGSTISRDEFVREVWKDSIVTDNTLNQAISKLRKVFEDEAVQSRIIETVSKRGYRLIAAVKKINDNDSTQNLIANSSFLSKRTWVVLLFVTTIFVAVLLYHTATSEKKEYPSQIFSSVDGMERQPSFSNDADKVVYVFGNVCNDESEIRIQSLGSDDVYSFAKFPGFKKFPRFSSDDNELIFWNESDNSSNSTLYLAKPPDTNLTILLQIPSSIRGLDWSPDKKLIVFSAKHNATGSFAVFLLDKNNNRVTQITRPSQVTEHDLFPVFSKDGKSITFIRADTEISSDIWQVNIETHNEVRLTYECLVIRGLSRAENGYYFTRMTDTKFYELVWFDDQSRDLRVITSFQEQLSSLSVRKNKIIFQTNTSAFSISAYNLISKRRSVLYNSNYIECFPKFSPRGDRFAFISNRTGPLLLWVGDVEGTQIKKISNFELSNTSHQPRWSHDESFILVDIVEQGEASIFRIDVKNGTATRFLKNASHPVFSDDGRFVYYNSRESGASQIWKTPTEGGERIQVTYGGGFIGFESSFDSSFYYMKETEDGIWQKKGTEERLILKEAGSSESENWSLHNQSIYYSKRYGGIWHYDIKTKTSTYVLSIDGSTCRMLTGISVSPDGQSLLFSSDERLESDLKIIEY